MKRVFSSITLIATCIMMLVSCSKKEVKSFVVPAEAILVSMPGQSGTTSFKSYNITSVTATSIPSGWSVDDIDMYEQTITVTAPSSFDKEEVTEGNITLTGYTPTGAKKSLSIYVAILPNADIDFSAEPANCYIATQAETRYRFNPYIGGNSTPLLTTRVELLWETKEGVIKYLDMRDGYVTFYIAEAEDKDGNAIEGKVTDGNALIGGYDVNDNLVWSWHIWVTNEDPRQSAVSLNGYTMMNINLGAFTNSNGEADTKKIHDSYGLYYQWGRKDPLPGPYTWDFYNNADYPIVDNVGERTYIEYVDSTADTGTTEWCISNPMSIILGRKDNSYNWLYSSTDDTLWNESAKSQNDPCPAGWMVPSSALYETLNIAAKDDAMMWEEAQPMYGWMLEDSTTGNQHFFSAAGRRNYLDGRLDNMNDDLILPIPWSGYYWTASTEGEEASAMYFDLNSETRSWNGFDAARPMHRANALPIRCVRIK